MKFNWIKTDGEPHTCKYPELINRQNRDGTYNVTWCRNCNYKVNLSRKKIDEKSAPR